MRITTLLVPTFGKKRGVFPKFEELDIDENGNTIIKVPEGTTRVLFQAYEAPPLTDTQFKTLLSEIRKNRSSIDEMKLDIKEMKSDIKRNYDLIKKYHPE